MAATHDLELRQGDGFRLGVRVAQVGAVFAGAVFAASVRRPGRPESGVAFTVEDLEVIDPDPGDPPAVTFGLALTPVQTRSLDHRREWAWDLQVTIDGGQPLTLLEGAVDVLPEVTV